LIRQDDIVAANASVGDLNIARNVTEAVPQPAIYALDDAIAKAKANGTPMKLGGGLTSISKDVTTPEQSEFLAMYNGIKGSTTMSDAEKRVALREVGAIQQARLEQGTDNPTSIKPLKDASKLRWLDHYTNTLGNSANESIVKAVGGIKNFLGISSPDESDTRLIAMEKASSDYQNSIKDSNLTPLEQVDKMAKDEQFRLTNANKTRLKVTEDIKAKSIKDVNSDPGIIKTKALIEKIVANSSKTTKKERRITPDEFRKSISDARKEFKASLSDKLTARQKNLRIAKFNEVASAEQKAFNLEQSNIDKYKREVAKLVSEQKFKIYEDDFNNVAKTKLAVLNNIAKKAIQDSKNKLKKKVDASTIIKNKAQAKKFNRGD